MEPTPVFYIALSGKRCSGKSTTATKLIRALEEKYTGLPVVKFAFAQALYAECYRRGMSSDPAKKDQKMLLEVAHEMRAADDKVFTKLTFEGIRLCSINPHCRGRLMIAVLDDLRHLPEVSALRAQKKSFLVRLNIPKDIQEARIRAVYGDEGFAKYNGAHKSETELDGQDALFDLTFDAAKYSLNVDDVVASIVRHLSSTLSSV